MFSMDLRIRVLTQIPHGLGIPRSVRRCYLELNLKISNQVTDALLSDYEFTEMWNSVQPAWTQIKDSLDYIGRNQFILQQGNPQVDLAFYLFGSPWNARAVYSASSLQNLGKIPNSG